MRKTRKRKELITYSNSALEKIAKSINASVKHVKQYHHILEAAARWYWLDRRSPRRPAPSHLVRRLNKVEKDATRLLLALGCRKSTTLVYELVDTDLIDALTLMSEPNSHNIGQSCDRLIRLHDLVQGIRAASETRNRAARAAREAREVGKLITSPGHHGDAAVNEWLVAMLSTYKEITGCVPKVSRTGPLMRFVQAAGEPLGIRYSQAAWFERLRRAQGRKNHQN